MTEIIALPGSRARLTSHESVLNYIFSGGGTLVDGDIVVINADGQTCSKVANATNKRYGVVVRHALGKTGKDANGNEAYKAGDLVPVMVIGSIYVKPAAVITDISAGVYVKTANATAQAPLGTIGTAATDSTALPGAAWESKTDAQGLAILRLLGA